MLQREHEQMTEDADEGTLVFYSECQSNIVPKSLKGNLYSILLLSVKSNIVLDSFRMKFSFFKGLSCSLHVLTETFSHYM